MPAGASRPSGRPPAHEFAKQVTAYKCHLKPVVMTVRGFQELHCQLHHANIPFLVDNEIRLAMESYCVHSKCRLYIILQIPEKVCSDVYCVMMSLTSAVSYLHYMALEALCWLKLKCNYDHVNHNDTFIKLHQDWHLLRHTSNSCCL